jgi:hypothetical protein
MTNAFAGYTEKEMNDSTRAWNDVLCTWRLCRNAACVRASHCCGRPRPCFRKHFPLLPEGVRAWFEGVGEAQIDRLTFDEAIEWLDATPAGEAFHEWRAAVNAPMEKEQ